ncbi:MAG: hypothetical protein NZ518_04890 [Dehalococcoidia bacterium]|nr:hypothetical protein [Dehalococcoidia bacterium]
MDLSLARSLLLFIHVTSFAVWLGAVVASLLFVRSLEKRLTGQEGDPAVAAAILRGYILRETKLVDVLFPTVVVSGVLMATFLPPYWTAWTWTKLALVALQFVGTIGFVRLFVRRIRYPCTVAEYRRWYQLFAISLSFFGATLLVVFFGR